MDFEEVTSVLVPLVVNVFLAILLLNCSASLTRFFPYIYFCEVAFFSVFCASRSPYRLCLLPVLFGCSWGRVWEGFQGCKIHSIFEITLKILFSLYFSSRGILENAWTYRHFDPLFCLLFSFGAVNLRDAAGGFTVHLWKQSWSALQTGQRVNFRKKNSFKGISIL